MGDCTFKCVDYIEYVLGKEPAVEKAEQVMYGALTRGLSFKVTMGNIITLTPASTITQKEMDKALDILYQCLNEAERE